MARNKIDEIAKLRKVVEQLRREKSVERMPVSETVQELIAYVTENLKYEQLLRDHRAFKGIVVEQDNPIGNTGRGCIFF